MKPAGTLALWAAIVVVLWAMTAPARTKSEPKLSFAEKITLVAKPARCFTELRGQPNNFDIVIVCE